jgi:hypothetical protein
MEKTKYNKIQESAVDIERIKAATSYALRKISTKKSKKFIAEVIGQSLSNFYNKINNNNFKPWEIINLFNFLISFYEAQYHKFEKIESYRETIKIPYYWSRLDVPNKKLHVLFYDYKKIQQELSRSLRNLSPRNILPKFTLARLLDMGLSTYHGRGNQRNFKTSELIEIIYFLVCFFDSNYK